MIFGSGSGFAASLDLSTLDGSNGLRLVGVDADDFSGRSVSTAGDVNGDGYDDILVGAYGADPGGDDHTGATYVNFGGGRGLAERAGGVEGTFRWLMEEVGELAAALREGDRSATAAEFADVLAWLATIANVAEIDLERAVVEKYGSGCPGCGEMVCVCDDAAKP
mgnify:CR=1 FL=1